MYNPALRFFCPPSRWPVARRLLVCATAMGVVAQFVCCDTHPSTNDIDNVEQVETCCDGGQLDAVEKVVDVVTNNADATPIEFADVVIDRADAIPIEFLPTNKKVPVVGDTCCLSVTKGGLLWAADGDIYEYSWVTGVTRLYIDDPGEQTEPVSDGDWLAWTDLRSGDRDVWVRHVPTGMTRVFAGGPGDQHSPDLSQGWLTWVGSDDPPFGPEQAEIWVSKLGDDSIKIRLTADDAEQQLPQISGDRVVFADFSNDPDKKYIDGVLPEENNGDIRGIIVSTRSAFDVIVDPAKQIRPAIDGDLVSWLDWRGITPEPKFVSLNVVIKNLVTGEEKMLAKTSWPSPSWWIRPAISGQRVAWVGSVDGDGALWLRVADSRGPIVDVAQVGWPMGGIVLVSDHVGWLSDGNLTISAIEMQKQ
ncbi:MAG: hypothetical protein HUU55_02725 [Myxococcales bacterium]|nr:hypothetical protein [Myxococcales bacterium]